MEIEITYVAGGSVPRFCDELRPVLETLAGKYHACDALLSFCFLSLPKEEMGSFATHLARGDWGNLRLHLEIELDRGQYLTLLKEEQRWDMGRRLFDCAREGLEKYKLPGLDVGAFLKDLEAACRKIGWLREEREFSALARIWPGSKHALAGGFWWFCVKGGRNMHTKLSVFLFLISLALPASYDWRLDAMYGFGFLVLGLLSLSIGVYFVIIATIATIAGGNLLELLSVIAISLPVWTNPSIFLAWFLSRKHSGIALGLGAFATLAAVPSAFFVGADEFKWIGPGYFLWITAIATFLVGQLYFHVFQSRMDYDRLERNTNVVAFSCFALCVLLGSLYFGFSPYSPYR
jgi:hypothetical protein